LVVAQFYQTIQASTCIVQTCPVPGGFTAQKAMGWLQGVQPAHKWGDQKELEVMYQ